MDAAPPPTRRPVRPQTLPDAARGLWPDRPPAASRIGHGARAVLRGMLAVGWTLLALPIQAVLIRLPGSGKVVFARWYWAVFTRLVGLTVRRIGVPLARGDAARRVIYVANHSSWLDIPVLGGQLEACFVSKDEIARWPGISIVARLGRTVFVSRTRGATGRERDTMAGRLRAGDNLLLFPEGTSSDGARVLPFRSPFFSVAEGAEAPLVQPVSVAYDRLAGLPTGRGTRSVFAWYGDMDLASHFWKLARWRGMRVTLLVHPPIDPRTLPNRKALSQAAWLAVDGGAALLRQNRPVPDLSQTVTGNGARNA